MAAITSAGSGNWNSTTPNAPWPSGTVPVSGDTVTLANGTTVTVPVGYTAVCGSSPADDTGTAALAAASGGNGTGVLVVNGTFKYRGPVRQGDATWTVGAGGTITYDASGAGTPAAALYTWQLGQNNGLTNCKLVFNGTTTLTAAQWASGMRDGNECTVDSVGDVQSGGFGNQATNWQGGGRITATFTDFSCHGPATTSGSFVKSNLNGSGSDLTFDDCTFSSCAQIEVTGPYVGDGVGMDGASVFRLRRCRFASPANADYTLQLQSGRPLSTGARLIEFCAIAGNAYVLPLGADFTTIVESGFTIRHNLFRTAGITTSGSVRNLTTVYGGVAEWKQNLLAMITGSSTEGQDPAAYIGFGTYSDSYLYRQNTPNGFGANMHPLGFAHQNGDLAIAGWVFHSTVEDTAGDMISTAVDTTGAHTLAVTGCVYLPNSLGLAVGSLVLQQGTVTQDDDKWTFDHNTIAAGFDTGSSLAAGVAVEGAATWPAGTIASVRSNLLYNRSSYTAWLTHSHASATLASGAITVADYNGLFNITGSVYGDASGKYGSTPGTHDVTGDPQFVDWDRSLLAFDQGYLAAAVGTAWATSTAYSVGDVRSNSDAGFFGGATYNWRCVAAHTSGAGSEPGVGDDYCQYWEPAALESIADDLIAGATYSGGTNSLVGELVAWVKDGFAPQNAIYQNAGHDSVTIGAVEGVFSSAATLPLVGGGLINGGLVNRGLIA